MPTEDVAVRDSLLRNRILQRASHRILPDDIYKLLWPVFSGENLITHGGTEFDYTYRKAGLTRRSRRKIRDHKEEHSAFSTRHSATNAVGLLQLLENEQRTSTVAG